MHGAASKLDLAASLSEAWAHWKAVVARTKACRALVSLLSAVTACDHAG